MKFSGKLKKELADLMQEIQDEFLLEKKGTTWFTFDTFPDDKVVSYDYQKGLALAYRRRMLLKKLAELDVLELKIIPQKDKQPELRFSIRLNHDQFEKLYRDLRTNNDQKSGIQYKGIVLHLDKSGDFWMEPKAQFCYPLDEDSERLKILAYLIDNRDYQLTDDIAEHVGNKKKQNVRTEIGKIGANINKFLKLDDVIQSKPSSGYRINPAYKIIKT